MKKTLPGFLLSLTLASLLHALPAGALSYPFSTSQAQFSGGDNITIQELLSTSPNLVPGTTIMVRGTYTLQSAASAMLAISLSVAPGTGSGSQPGQPAARTTVNAGSGTFELEYAIQLEGTLHITFGPLTSGSSFGSVYFNTTAGAPSSPSTPYTPSAPYTPTTPTTPSTPVPPNLPPAPPVNTVGLTSVPFATRNAQFLSGDSITIQQVLASSPNLVPGDVVMVRGTYALQSSTTALLMISLSANAPGGWESVSPSSRLTVNASSGTYEVAYLIQQPGSLHVTFYPPGSGSAFGGIYFGPPSSVASTTSGATLVSPASNTGQLGNLSIRSNVSPGDGALIAGMVVTDRERYVLIRAVGPTLAAFGVSGTLPRPMLSVYNAAGQLVASAGSWTTNFSAAQRAGIELVSASVGAFALNAGSDDAVLHLRLVPGAYTITVSSGDDKSGTALMEVYASSTFSLPLAAQ